MRGFLAAMAITVAASLLMAASASAHPIVWNDVKQI
ncbi:MAG: hypothetical protein JWM91_3511 [Rhodospirillales bacterium]|nr:hypothetical protein [Rhodospirillales bacterium]